MQSMMCCIMQMYAEGEKNSHTQTLHHLRNDFGVSSSLLGGILALHPLSNDFGASSCFTHDGVIPAFYILHVGEICPCIE